MNLGFSEIFMIFVVALLLFGPDKLPELARMVGKAVREFRKASAELQYTMRDTIDHLQEGRSPEAPLRDLAQKYDPRALIQEAIARPLADDDAGPPPSLPADTGGLGIASPPGEPMAGAAEPHGPHASSAPISPNLASMPGLAANPRAEVDAHDAAEPSPSINGPHRDALGVEGREPGPSPRTTGTRESA